MLSGHCTFDGRKTLNERGVFFNVKQGVIDTARNALVVVQTLANAKLSYVRNYIILIVKDRFFLFVQYLQEVMFYLVQADQNLSDVEKKATYFLSPYKVMVHHRKWGRVGALNEA